MLEDGTTLRTWALDQPPRPGRSISGEQLPDHRLAYLDYEGPVSGNRGTVSQCDGGAFDVIARTETKWEVYLRGRQLDGQLTLVADPGEPRHWIAHFAGT